MINCIHNNQLTFQGGLKRNLRKGESALKEYKREIPYVNSSTLIWQRTQNIENKHGIHMDKMWDLTKRVRHDIARERMDVCFLFNADYELYKDLVKDFMQYKKVGNCGECADMMREYLKKDFDDVKVIAYVMGDEDKNHVFCVVGMDKDADVKKPSTWGNKAVVVDAWRGFVSSVPDAIEEYNKFFKVNLDDYPLYFYEVDYYD